MIGYVSRVKKGSVELPTRLNPNGAQETCGRERNKQSRVLEKLTMPQIVKRKQKALLIAREIYA